MKASIRGEEPLPRRKPDPTGEHPPLASSSSETGVCANRPAIIRSESGSPWASKSMDARVSSTSSMSHAGSSIASCPSPSPVVAFVALAAALARGVACGLGAAASRPPDSRETSRRHSSSTREAQAPSRLCLRQASGARSSARLPTASSTRRSTCQASPSEPAKSSRSAGSDQGGGAVGTRRSVSPDVPCGRGRPSPACARPSDRLSWGSSSAPAAAGLGARA
mmetsp:Transcript_85644/g.239185  ORF Transcript_85644/g.239185 Transcript_85644/m.239185 type:complete len:223 (+) Transcript_85644:466-1134(+)